MPPYVSKKKKKKKGKEAEAKTSPVKSCLFLLGLCLCVLAGAYLALCIATHETPVVAKCALIKAFDAKTDVSKVPCPQDAAAKLRAVVEAKDKKVGFGLKRGKAG